MKVKREVLLLGAALVASGVQADSITHGGTTINMDFVNIGYAGNAGDASGYGAVADNYRMGKFEVTATQWASVIAADSDVGDTGSRSGSEPTASSSWLEAAKFANWLTSGSYNNGAYQFSDPSTLTAVDRMAAIATYGTVYVLPTEDEWYKAAYLKSDGSAYTLYATGDSVPTAGAGGENYNNINSNPWDVGSGSVSSIENNGTFDMGGNVWEWNESAGDGTLNDMTESRVIRGGVFDSNESALRSLARISIAPTLEGNNIGFRVAAIPEPSSMVMVGVVSGLGLFVRRRLSI